MCLSYIANSICVLLQYTSSSLLCTGNMSHAWDHSNQKFYSIEKGPYTSFGSQIMISFHFLINCWPNISRHKHLCDPWSHCPLSMLQCTIAMYPFSLLYLLELSIKFPKLGPRFCQNWEWKWEVRMKTVHRNKSKGLNSFSHLKLVLRVVSPLILDLPSLHLHCWLIFILLH